MSITVTVEHNGTVYDAEIAEVESTSLGTEDHGIFTAQVNFKGNSWGQGIPARGLATQSHADSNGYGIDHIWSIIRTIGAADWEGLRGTKCLVLREKRYSMIRGVANLDGERVLIFDEHHEAWEVAHPRPSAVSS